MVFDGSEYLVIVDYYSKMPIVRKMPTSQCNSAKTITVLKELFAEHGIPEEIRSDNGPQFDHLRLRICNTNFSIWIKLKRGML